MVDGVLPALAGLILVLVAFLLVVVTRMAEGQARTEQKVDTLLRHAGIDLAAAAADQVAALVREGKKIQAIKLYRSVTGCGLAEAKERVETLGDGR